ncbi:MAG: MATE family efflux transporter, partial [Muribaculaceae bacterium]|nr:MATE family efflux transporter [Muribaculaceae bacterium]
TSTPVSLQMTLESASFSVAAIMAGWIGTIALASYQIITMVSLLGFCIYYSMSSSAAILVSNAAGRGDNAEMRRAAFAVYKVVLTIAVAMSLLFFFAGKTLICAFTDDTVLIAYSLTLIPPMILYQLGDATQVTFACSLRGTANVMPMLWIALTSYVIIGIPAAYIFAFPMGWGGQGIVYSFSVSLFLAAALYLFFFLRTTKTRNQS